MTTPYHPGETAAGQPQAASAVDPAEIHKFDGQAHEFWDLQGAFAPLHALNPVRIDYIRQRCELSNVRVLDVGCGGGLVAEALTQCGSTVTAIDMAANMVEVASLHARASGLNIDYRHCAVEDLGATDAPWPVITCMEMIEHVPDPSQLLRALAARLAPGGHLFMSTINRNFQSFLTAIVGAEYLLRLIPRGTHEYARLLKPSELASMGRNAGLALRDVTGVSYNPLTRTARLTASVTVNYMAHLQRESARS